MRIRFLLPVSALLLLLTLCSCDLLRFSPFEVSAWEPGPGIFEDPEQVRVSLLFSGDSNRASVEEAFSLTADNAPVKGSFLWLERLMVFNAAAPLERNKLYKISLSTEAVDSNGVNLERDFNASFSTRPAGERLLFISISPEYDGTMTEARGTVRIKFTQPLLLSSCYTAVSFAPSISGIWTLEDEGNTACFVPDTPWKHNTRYTVTVKNTLSGLNGLTLGEEAASRFITGQDRDGPVPVKVWALEKSGLMRDLGNMIQSDPLGPVPSFVCSDWETDAALVIDFSEPVDTLSVQNSLRAEPISGTEGSLPLIMETPPGFSARTAFSFSARPPWQSAFLFRLSAGVKDAAGNESLSQYTLPVFAGGAYSRPPSLAGLRFPGNPVNAPDYNGETHGISNMFETIGIQGENAGDPYPYSTAVSTWIELYFDVAPETEVDLLSLMELFRVETSNNAIVFSPRSISVSDFHWTEPADRFNGCTRIEIRGLLTNSINSGLVSFYIGEGLRDSRGNKNGNVMRISLQK